MKKPEFRGMDNKEIFDIIAPRLVDNLETLCDPYFYSNDRKIDPELYRTIMMDADYVRIHNLEYTRRLQIRFKTACSRRIRWSEDKRIITGHTHQQVHGLNTLKKALEEYIADTSYASKKILY